MKKGAWPYFQQLARPATLATHEGRHEQAEGNEMENENGCHGAACARCVGRVTHVVGGGAALWWWRRPAGAAAQQGKNDETRDPESG